MIAYEDGQRASADSFAPTRRHGRIYAEPLHWPTTAPALGRNAATPSYSAPRIFARTKRVHQLSREGSSVSRRFQVYPANTALLGTYSGTLTLFSHGGNPGSNPR